MAPKSSELEDSVEGYLCTQASAHGGVALKLRPPKGRGFPDRTLVLPSAWTAFVEVKRPTGGVVAKHQTSWGSTLASIPGHRFYIVTNRAEVDALFAAYRQEKST